MDEATVKLVSIAVGAAGSVIIPVVGYFWRLTSRFEALAAQVAVAEGKTKELHSLSSGQANHEVRISVIESVVEELKGLSNTFQTIAQLTAKMETILQNSERRLELIEDAVFRHSKK